jgi:hypothetical protein
MYDDVSIFRYNDVMIQSNKIPKQEEDMSLQVLDQFPFEFYGEYFTVALASDRKIYVPMTGLCQTMGLQTQGQVRRIQNNEAVADALVRLTVTWGYGDAATQEREVYCLRLDILPFWMGTIQPNRIPDEERRKKIILFQREFAAVAWAAFRREILPEDMLAEMESTLPPSEQQFLQAMDEAIGIRQELGELGERVAVLEAKLRGTDFINTSQMKAYQQMVGLVAYLLKKKNKGSESHVHAEVKQVFDVPSYRLIPEEDFPRVQHFLRDWYMRLAGPGAAVPSVFDAPSQRRLI